MSGEKTAITQPEPELESLFSRMARRNDADDDNDDKDDSDGANDGEDDAEDQVPLESMDQVSRFQDITVWNHEMVPSADESFSRGVNEWLAFAQVIHGTTLAES